jgi:hypothetical protein
MIDVRCRYREPIADGQGDALRCQLLAGHEGEHALMYCRAGHRRVRTWAAHAGDPRSRCAASISEHEAGQEPLPWTPGMPRPAWSEDH